MAQTAGLLKGLRFSIVGPGKVGSSLAHWAVQLGAEAVQISGRSRGPTEALAASLGATAELLPHTRTEGQDLLLVAVSDHALPEVTEQLAMVPQAAVALHTSGSQGASALDRLRASGTAVGTIHPLRAFPELQQDVGGAIGTVFGIDGDPEARETAHRLVAAFKGTAVQLEESDRLLYHFAATLAAGGIVTLIAAAEEILESRGLPAAVMTGYLRLAQEALSEVERLGSPVAAITGPVARGDRELVKQQLDELGNEVPELVPLVTELARQTLRQLETAGDLNDNRRELRADLDKLRAVSSFLDP